MKISPNIMIAVVQAINTVDHKKISIYIYQGPQHFANKPISGRHIRQ